MTKDEFSLIYPNIPTQAGVYRYFNEDDKIIYVGKAKNLKKRVGSYFNKNQAYYKTKRLVEDIVRMEFTIVDTEQDALLLENSLIKQYQPKYNLMLKDDRSYPYIVIKNEEFPRIFLTRRLIKDGSTYLGPYTAVHQVRSLFAFLKQTIPIRSCNLSLTEKSIAQGKFKECLEYHIGNCLAPCVGFQTKVDYDNNIEQIRKILKGRLQEVRTILKQQMTEYAEQLEFEKAENRYLSLSLNLLKSFLLSSSAFVTLHLPPPVIRSFLPKDEFFSSSKTFLCGAISLAWRAVIMPAGPPPITKTSQCISDKLFVTAFISIIIA